MWIGVGIAIGPLRRGRVGLTFVGRKEFGKSARKRGLGGRTIGRYHRPVRTISYHDFILDDRHSRGDKSRNPRGEAESGGARAARALGRWPLGRAMDLPRRPRPEGLREFGSSLLAPPPFQNSDKLGKQMRGLWAAILASGGRGGFAMASPLDRGGVPHQPLESSSDHRSGDGLLFCRRRPPWRDRRPHRPRRAGAGITDFPSSRGREGPAAWGSSHPGTGGDPIDGITGMLGLRPAPTRGIEGFRVFCYALSGWRLCRQSGQAERAVRYEKSAGPKRQTHSIGAAPEKTRLSPWAVQFGPAVSALLALSAGIGRRDGVSSASGAGGPLIGPQGGPAEADAAESTGPRSPSSAPRAGKNGNSGPRSQDASTSASFESGNESKAEAART